MEVKVDDPLAKKAPAHRQLLLHRQNTLLGVEGEDPRDDLVAKVAVLLDESRCDIGRNDEVFEGTGESVNAAPVDVPTDAYTFTRVLSLVEADM